MKDQIKKDYKTAPTNVNNNKTPTKQSGKGRFKLTKKQIGIIGGVAAVLVAALVVVFVLVLGRKQPQDETGNNTDTVETTRAVDYNQRITSEDGSEFKAEYQAGSEQSFAMRFSDLKCKDSCKNVNEVKLGDKVLKEGEDYEVKSGSIIIILTNSFMKSLQANKYDLVIAVVDKDKTLLYGVKFTVKPESTCGDDEILEKGECVKKPEEQPSQNNQQGGNTTTKPSTQPSKPSQQPSQPSTPSKPQAQIDCENRQGPIGYAVLLRPQPDNRYGLPDWNMYWGMTGDNYFDNGATSMVWAGGVCRVHVKDVPKTGSYGVIYTPEQLQQQKPDIYGKMVSNPSKDLVMWYWANGQTTYDFYDNGQVIFNY